MKNLSRDAINRMFDGKVGSSSSIGGGGGGGGLASVALAQLTDVELTNLANNDVLIYSSSLSKWVNYAGMATQSWADGRFLKLSGGTMTGIITREGTAIQSSNGYNQVYVSNAYAIFGYDNARHGIPTYIDGHNIYLRTGSNHAYTTTIDSSGNITCQSVEIGHGNEINAANGSNLYLQYRNNGHLILCYNGANVGIGAMSSPSYKLHVDGVIYSSTGVYSAGYVTALSDIRKKDVVEDFVLKVADIAKARLIKFTWKDKHDTDVHAGGIAQEWQKILPESVRETAEGELAMDYGVIAVAASVSLAREVVGLQKKVASLEARLARFEKMFAINANDSED